MQQLVKYFPITIFKSIFNIDSHDMALNFFIIGIVAGIALIAIGAMSIIMSLDAWAFTRGMMLIITGVIIIALGIRFKALGR